MRYCEKVKISFGVRFKEIMVYFLLCFTVILRWNSRFQCQLAEVIK